MKNQPVPPHSVAIIRVAFWGQVIGFLAKATFLAFEDAPDFFARVSPLTFLVPLIGIAALYFLRLDRFVAANLSSTYLAVSVLLIAGSTTLLALLLAIRAYRIPEFLVTPGWEYTRVTSVFILVLSALALAANIYMIVRATGAGATHDTGDTRRRR